MPRRQKHSFKDIHGTGYKHNLLMSLWGELHHLLKMTFRVKWFAPTVCSLWECEQWTINPPPGFLVCTLYACLRESVDSDPLVLWPSAPISSFLSDPIFLHDTKRHTWIVFCDKSLFYPRKDAFLSKRQFKQNTNLLVTPSQAVLVSAATQLTNLTPAPLSYCSYVTRHCPVSLSYVIVTQRTWAHKDFPIG